MALSLYFGAYATEILRAGLDSIPRSQIEAGHCLGLSSWQVYRHIVLAPALRNVYPALGSQLVILLLGTSLASQVSPRICSTPAASSKAAPTAASRSTR